MKLLTFAIPCYNSEAYMRNCIDSLLPGGEDVEILIIDDGSKDETARIADEYQEKYPTIVRAIHQENGGHGAAVNAGIANATGLYFKVVDSDDWVKESAYQEILETLRELVGGEKTLDMLISNFVYEKVGEKHNKDEIPTCTSGGNTFYLEGCASFFQRAVYFNAFRYLSNQDIA